MAAKNIKELLKKTRQRRRAELTLSTGDVIVFFFMPLTEAEDGQIREAVEGDLRSNAYGLKVLVTKAEYEDGSKVFAPAETGMIRQEYAKADITKMMECLIFNGGALASEDPKSDKGGDKE